MVRLAVLCWAGWSWCGVVTSLYNSNDVTVAGGMVVAAAVSVIIVVINVVCKEECAGLDGALSLPTSFRKTRTRFWDLIADDTSLMRCHFNEYLEIHINRAGPSWQ